MDNMAEVIVVTFIDPKISDGYLSISDFEFEHLRYWRLTSM